MSIKLSSEHVVSCFFLLWRKIKNSKIQKQRKKEKRAEMKNKKGKAPCQKRETNMKVCKLKCHSSKHTSS